MGDSAGSDDDFSNVTNMLNKVSFVTKTIDVGDFRLSAFDLQFPMFNELAGKCWRAQAQALHRIRNRIFVAIMGNVPNIEQQAITSIEVIGFRDLVSEPVITRDKLR